jgi:hypothetical protein
MSHEGPSLGGKAAGAWSWPLTSKWCRGREQVSIYSLPHTCTYRVNFTYLGFLSIETKAVLKVCSPLSISPDTTKQGREPWFRNLANARMLTSPKANEYSSLKGHSIHSVTEVCLQRESIFSGCLCLREIRLEKSRWNGSSKDIPNGLKRRLSRHQRPAMPCSSQLDTTFPGAPCYFALRHLDYPHV